MEHQAIRDQYEEQVKANRRSFCTYSTPSGVGAQRSSVRCCVHSVHQTRSGPRLCSFRSAWTDAQALRSRAVKRTSCVAVDCRMVAAVLQSPRATFQAWSASANIDGKSACSVAQRIRPATHRERHSALVTIAPVEGVDRTWTARAMRSRWSATVRFSPRLRRSLACARIPVGMWVRKHAVSTLFLCCPPGPLTRPVRTSQAASNSSGGRHAGWSIDCFGSTLLHPVRRRSPRRPRASDESGSATVSHPSRSPRPKRSAPVAAIIAALSVQ